MTSLVKLLKCRHLLCLIGLLATVSSEFAKGQSEGLHYGPPLQFPENQKEIVLPLKRAGNWLLAPLKINGTEAGLFIVDTGGR